MRLPTLAIAPFVLALGGCATLGKPETFALCKTTDVASTIYAVESGKGQEKNPVLAGSVNKGNYLPLIGLAALAYYTIKNLNNPTVTTVANAATCGVAANNLRIGLK